VTTDRGVAFSRLVLAAALRAAAPDFDSGAAMMKSKSGAALVRRRRAVWRPSGRLSNAFLACQQVQSLTMGHLKVPDPDTEFLNASAVIG
jgi:hypothetical protein